MIPTISAASLSESSNQSLRAGLAVVTYARNEMVSASDTGHLVFVEQLLDEALGLGVELHEDDVGGVDRQLKGRLPPGDVLVEEELERKDEKGAS